MDWLQAFILGILQGLTEFLPISSSGHLVLAQHILDVETPGILLEVVLHMGTLVAILIYFYDDIRKNFKFSQYTDNTYNINNVNIRPGSDVSGKDDFDTPMDHLGKDTREEMR